MTSHSKAARFLPLAVCAAALSACASGPQTTAALEQAQAEYRLASTDPRVTTNAPLELRRAEEALVSAQQAAGSATEIDHRAYLARQRIAIARETAELKQARDQVGQADSLRAQSLLQTRTQQVQQAQARAQSLEQQVRDLQAQRTDRGILVTLGDLLFATGRANLTPGAEARVAEVARFLQANPGTTAQIEGHTDSTGSSQTNLRLSEARADSVRDALVRNGIEPQRLQATGYGAARPVSDNGSQSGRQANRRVEIVITDPEGRVAVAPPAQQPVPLR
ncbi:OmpA family protein [Arenibaculum pallidiluteum]|uniref:OmpA family protein n=1 Tax=Arenibaculum pallidiluteum TaxID=2812559 RepID=UPI001A9581D6|nr:OmpA family protein [Arenibaculum pallidiluteum]